MADTLRADARVPGHAVTLRRVLAQAFGDPTLEIAFAHDDGWADADGRSLTDLGDRAVREVRDEGALVAAIVHDAALDVSDELADAGVAMARVVLENERLRQSRARLTAGAERERRRIERDLHDGAQQRLVALRIELELAEELVRRDPARGADRLRELEQEVDDALEELRTLAHGVYPPLLADRGLAGGAARRHRTLGADDRAARARGRALPARGRERGLLLHARSAAERAQARRRARRARSSARRERRGELRFELRDDGAGGTITPGHGNHQHARPPDGDRRRRERQLIRGRDDRPRPSPRGSAARARVTVASPSSFLQPARGELLLAHAGRDVA